MASNPATQPPTNILDQLKRDEGLRLYPYADTTGNLTVGYGHNLTANGISQDAADLLLEDDLAIADKALKTALPWTANLDLARYGALLNMTFNMGIRGLLGFHNALRAMQSGDWKTAGAELLSSEWAAQVGDRAKRLALQLESGEWQ
jgi:lysozyme